MSPLNVGFQQHADEPYGCPTMIEQPAERPWGTKSLARVGDGIRSGTPAGPNDPSYDDVMIWYNDLATWVQSEIESMDWGPLLGSARPSLVSRPKTIDTLRQKLARQPHMDLGSVQDIAGVRFEAEMTLDQQDAVAAAIAAHFDHDQSCIRDLRIQPHSGYRSVHVWLRFEKRGRVEVQVRTHMQGAWANHFERTADVLGRGIRYDEKLADVDEARYVQQLIDLSIGPLTRLEDARNRVARAALDEDDRDRGIVASLAPSGITDLDTAWSTVRDVEQLVYETFAQSKTLLDQIAEERMSI